MKISVIIPAFDVEDTIERCIDSVLAQTYPLYEIIVVEDCSTDGTLEKLKKYQGSIKLIVHDQNKGLGITRCDGISAATGDWLYFLDSDDYIDPDAIKYLVDNADGGDIVSGGIENRPLSGKEAILHYKKCKTTFINNRLIKKSLFELAPHSELRYLEDFDTIPRLIFYAKKCTYAPLNYYHYNTENPASLNATAGDMKRFMYLAICNLRNYLFFKCHRPEWTECLGYGLDATINLSMVYGSVILNGKDFHKYLEEARQIKTLLSQALSLLDF